MLDFKLLIAQVGVILIVARLVGWLFRKLHQPRVIGEMVAGIMLGPSLLGWLAPGASAALFPQASLGYLNALSQIGLLLFMFLVGLELDLEQLRKLGRAAMTTSLTSIIAPFILGFLLAIYLYPRLSDRSVNFTGFALFMSIAMSITAFPVLARILTERNMLRSRVGSVAITCAAVDDVTAWIILAGIIVLIRASSLPLPLWMMLAGLGVFVLVMLVVTLLLPLFFAFTGLRSSFFLISGAQMWFYCAVIIALAIIGKLCGSLVAARINGMSWREAAAVGVLMNTRGLVDLGILSQTLFSIMVLMALVTTFMTSPLLSWIYPERLVRTETPT